MKRPSTEQQTIARQLANAACRAFRKGTLIEWQKDKFVAIANELLLYGEFRRTRKQAKFSFYHPRYYPQQVASAMEAAWLSTRK